MGTSCPDHFLRTRISPMFVRWNAGRRGLAGAQAADRRAARHSTARTTRRTTRRIARAGLAGAARLEPVGRRHPRARAVRVRQGQARSAHHHGVLRQRDPRDGGRERARGRRRRARRRLPQARHAEQAAEFKSFQNYVALPRSEAFRIEYWALEEAKLQRMPPEREFSRQIAVVVGGAQRHRPRGRAAARQARRPRRRRRSRTPPAPKRSPRKPARCRRRSWCSASALDLSVAREHRRRVPRHGRCGSAASTSSINTAAIYPTPGARHAARRRLGAGDAASTSPATTCCADEAAKILKEQGLPASIVLTSSANAVVPKSGSEPYDVSKAAINHLIRELAIGLGPLVRVNGIAPATVVAGSVDVPARPRDGVAARNTASRSTEDESRPKPCAASSRSSTRAARSRTGRFCRSTAPTRSVPGRGPEREDHRPRHSGGRRVAGGVPAVTCQIPAPNPKLQPLPNAKSQTNAIPNPKERRTGWDLELGSFAWDLGVGSGWSLGFGSGI